MMKTWIKTLLLVFVLAGTFSFCGKPKKEIMQGEIRALEVNLQHPDQGFKTAYEKRYHSDRLIDLYKAFAKAFPQDNNSPEFLYRAAMVYADTFKDYHACVKVLQETATQWPDHPFGEKALFLAGYTFAEQLNDLEKAKLTYTLFIERYPDSELLPSVQFELQNLGTPVDLLLPNLTD